MRGAARETKLKILMTNFHERNGGGHVAYVINLLKCLSQEHTCFVATPATSRLYRQAAELPNVTVVGQTFSARFSKSLPEIRALRRLIREQRFDVIHVNASVDHRHVMQACLGLRPRPRIVLTKHNKHSVTSLGHRLRANLATDAVIAVSAYVRELLEQSPYRCKSLYSIHHGVDTDWFAPVDAVERARLRQALFGEAADGLIVLASVGGTDYDKGWLDLVQAVGQLPEAQRAAFRIIVAGDMPNEEKKARVQALGMRDQVLFPGLLEDVRTVLGAADAGFVLSYHEALSFACRESMAMGLPMLVSDAGGLPENVTSGEDGWIVPAGRPDAIRPVLEALLSDGGRLPGMSAAARRKAVEQFSLKPFADATLKAYLGA